VYFSDIRGFTSFSEGMDPERLVELLNDYLSSVTAVIERHGGYVDKYVGDAVMAIWGAPVPDEDHAARACAAALEIRDGIAASRPGWKERFGVELRARAGINTGPMVAGNVGSTRKANYTVLGQAVNLASRLEGANKAYGTDILIGERTWELARGSIVARPIDVIRVAGAEHPVAAFEPLALAGSLPPEAEQRLATWREAIACYRQLRPGEALAHFVRCAELAPGDATAAILAARCRQLLITPPPASWDGVHSLQEK
jgi:adenylate cyclase